jgi:predicted Fe-Mo cluster-binding NifX family protein
MRIAIPTWSGRISPVFDVARHVLLIDVEAGQEVKRAEAYIEASQPWTRARRMTELEVDTLICGAISGPLEFMLASAGVRVIPHACGPVEQVLGAFLAGSLTEDAFLMPGLGGRRRRRHGPHGHRGGNRGRVGRRSVGEGWQS